MLQELHKSEQCQQHREVLNRLGGLLSQTASAMFLCALLFEQGAETLISKLQQFNRQFLNCILADNEESCSSCKAPDYSLAYGLS